MKTMKATKKLTPIPELLGKAQKVFNAYIRRRDQGKKCITCHKPGDQAGHYWPVKYSGVRFDEMNVHLQETSCNKWGHGEQAKYRMRLVEMYGEDAVRKLDEKAIRTQKVKWDRYELEELIRKYKTK